MSCCCMTAEVDEKRGVPAAPTAIFSLPLSVVQERFSEESCLRTRRCEMLAQKPGTHSKRVSSGACAQVRQLRPPPPKPAPLPLRAVPLVLERLSGATAPVRLPQRNSPIAEVDESALEAASHKGSGCDGDRSEAEVLKDVRSRAWLNCVFDLRPDPSGGDRPCGRRMSRDIASKKPCLSLRVALDQCTAVPL